MSWLHIHTNKCSIKFQINWTSSGSTVKCSKMDVLQTLLKMLSPPNDTPIFCKFLCDNTTESSEIWRHGSYWLIESYCVVFMKKTYSLELKIEFNDFTVSLRGGWLYLHPWENRSPAPNHCFSVALHPEHLIGPQTWPALQPAFLPWHAPASLPCVSPTKQEDMGERVIGCKTVRQCWLTCMWPI